MMTTTTTAVARVAGVLGVSAAAWLLQLELHIYLDLDRKFAIQIGRFAFENGWQASSPYCFYPIVAGNTG
jgi:hypothetical protein